MVLIKPRKTASCSALMACYPWLTLTLLSHHMNDTLVTGTSATKMGTHLSRTLGSVSTPSLAFRGFPSPASPENIANITNITNIANITNITNIANIANITNIAACQIHILDPTQIFTIHVLLCISVDLPKDHFKYRFLKSSHLFCLPEVAFPAKELALPAGQED